MSNWDYANEAEIEAARQAYDPSDPKHPDYTDTYHTPTYEEQPMELAPIEPDEIILFTGNPAERMRQMQETAAILAEPVRARHVVKIGSTEHVRVEGWTMLGALLGVHPYLVWSRVVLDPENQTLGWEARVEARTITGQTVGSAEAECLYTEKNWSDRDDYALRSMAQTRATSKALRQPLGFVITLAGFDPTPAEEMPASSFKPPTLEESRRLMFSLRDRLIRAGAISDEQAFTDQIKADYEQHPGRLNAKDTGDVITRLQAALDKHHGG
jgi:hypothetical protein